MGPQNHVKTVSRLGLTVTLRYCYYVTVTISLQRRAKPGRNPPTDVEREYKQLLGKCWKSECNNQEEFKILSQCPPRSIVHQAWPLSIKGSCDVRGELETHSTQRSQHLLPAMYKRVFVACLLLGTVLAEEKGETRGPSGADIANQAAAQATAAAAGLGGAAHAAAAGAASNAAAAAFAASQTAQAAAASKQAQAAAVTQAAQGAQAAAFAEGSLASKANIAYQAAKLTASMAQGLAANVATILSEAKALASQATTSHAEQQAFLNGQRTMAWQAQQAANSLNQQQYTALSDLEDAAGAAAQARAAATKALSKAKGASGYGH
ncbi:cilia- and flagella-associated protein 91-like [Penaeus monodon]|uniref:cilia- and flagella-associated protein 91-like n=1 Tax=Penaeus monodon TaxID=6687 RepID=UPI0018A6DD31|nr:cilia- and flagella-associated protein 91-like [Penaeus monodon]